MYRHIAAIRRFHHSYLTDCQRVVVGTVDRLAPAERVARVLRLPTGAGVRVASEARGGDAAGKPAEGAANGDQDVVAELEPAGSPMTALPWPEGRRPI